ncbi:MAG: hypothetical protein DHS20C17_03290 [Cyclobacteriaceae bacterium]|nr:MAG: hypothetical protein DHS20C17_03290 [Cyclobacteriaceae bacterium]
MGFYHLSKEERAKLVEAINQGISDDLTRGKNDYILEYFADEDTYIRKAGYQAIGKMYRNNKTLRPAIIDTLRKLLDSESDKVRQTSINAAGEIGKFDFDRVRDFFDKGLFDNHHSVRNAVIGSIKKMGEKNPQPTLQWANQYLHHPDKEIRREICHGIELRGRTHPQDILPMLELLQNDQTARVRNTLIHVLGQIAYKKGCLETVVQALIRWDNRKLVEKAFDEIVDVHERYKDFAALTPQQAIDYIDKNQ